MYGIKTIKGAGFCSLNRDSLNRSLGVLFLSLFVEFIVALFVVFCDKFEYFSLETVAKTVLSRKITLSKKVLIDKVDGKK